MSRFLYGICFNFFLALTGYPGQAPTALGCPIQRITDKKRLSEPFGPEGATQANPNRARDAELIGRP